MAWGKAKAAPKPSTFSQLLPLFIILVILGIGAFVGYQIWLSMAKIQKSTEESLKKRNMAFSKDGMKVSVRQVEQENYVDATQSWVVKAWNMGSSAAQSAASTAASTVKRD